MQITEAEQPLRRPSAPAQIVSPAAWYDPDSVTFMDAADAQAAPEEPAPRNAEAERTPILEPA